MEYIVLGTNSSNMAQAFGTFTGRTYRSEEAAERAAKVMRRDYPRLDFLVLPVSNRLDELED